MEFFIKKKTRDKVSRKTEKRKKILKETKKEENLQNKLTKKKNIGKNSGSHVNVVFFIMILFYYNNEQRTKLLQCDYPDFWKMTEFYELTLTLVVAKCN